MPTLLLGPQSSLLGASALLGLIAHQAFRRYETYNPLVHASLLTLPPTLAALLFRTFTSTSTADGRWGLAFVAYLGALVLSVVAYRLSPTHPLARYPGPWAAKVSKVYMAVRCLPGYQYRYVKGLHDRYGDVVRIGPNELSVRDASLVPALLGPSGAGKGPHMVGRWLSDQNLPMIGMQETEDHLRRRRTWTRGLGANAVKGYEEFVAARTRQLIGKLEAREGGRADLREWFNFFSYDVMSDMAFGGGSELLSGADKQNFWATFDDALSISTFLGHVPWLGIYVGYVPPIAAAITSILDHCRDLTKMRLSRESVRKDLFHYLHNEDLADTPPPPIDHLVEDGILAIMAGADTVASALTNLFGLLLAHPDVYAVLEAEVDSFYPPGEDAVDTKHHRAMPYLNAVINEALRLMPPGPNCTQRQVPREGPGITAGSRYFPPGTSFWVHIHSIHRDARNFAPMPEAFWPDRWTLAASSQMASDGAKPATTTGSAKTGTGAVEAHNPSAFLAFSYGPMNCAGKSLAMLELRMVVCALVQRFRIRIREGEGWSLGAFQDEYRDYYVTTRGRLPVVLEPR